MASKERWPASPFRVGHPVEDARLFVGRESIVKPVQQLIEAHAPGALIEGPRRFGKTSVLNHIEHNLGYSYVVGRVDLKRLWEQRALTGWAPGEIVPRALEWLIASLAKKLPLDPDLRHPFAPDSFRTVALPKINEALLGRHLVVFFDELEVLHDEDPSAVRLLLSSFDWDSGRQTETSLVVIWGRPFGGVVTDGQPSPLKDLPAYPLEALTPENLERLVRSAFESLAEWPTHVVDHLHSITEGHPLYAVAICEEVWQRLSAENANRPVVIEDLENVIAPAANRLVTSLDDVWRQLDLPEKLVLRVVAGLAPRPGTATSIDAIAAALHDAGRRTDPDEIERARQTLYASRAVVLDSHHTRIVSPVLSTWLTTRKSPEGIIADHSEEDNVLLEAKRAWGEGREAEARGDLDAAMGQYLRAFDQAPKMWKAGFAAAHVDLQRGRLDEALARLRVLPPTSEVLRARREALLFAARTAWAQGRTPHEALDELQHLDPGLALTQGADGFFAEIKVEQWRRSLEVLPPAAWKRACEDLASTAPPPWWPAAVRHFGQLLQDHLEHDLSRDDAGRGQSLDRTIALITIVLPWLAREAPSDSSTLGDVARTAAEWQAAGIGADSLVGEKLAEFLSQLKAQDANAGAAGAGHQRMSSAWKMATTVLKRMVIDSSDLERLSISVRSLQPLVQAAPKSVRSSLAEVFQRWLGGRLLDALVTEPNEARAIAMVAVDLRDSRILSDVLEACLKRVFETVDGPQPESIRALLVAWPGVASTLLRAIKDGALAKDVARDLADQTGLLLEQVNGPVEWGLDFPGMSVKVLRDEWRELIAQFPSIADGARLVDERFPEGATAPSAAVTKTRLLTERDVNRLLGDEYTDVSREPRYRVPSVPVQALQAFRATRQGVRLLVRVYAVEASDPDTQAFLLHLWDTERRILYDLGTRWEGRALPRLYDARFDPDTGALLLVTEWLGVSTIRNHLDDGRVGHERREDIATLWKHLASLFSAVAAMHDAGFLHRSIRPEHVRVDETAEQMATARYRLADFESAVFLYGLDNAKVATRDQLDRYCAPEVLEAELTRHRVAAESRAADAYALGLLVYECVVGPLTPSELIAASGSWSYEEHSTWLRGLINRAQSAFTVFEEERQILRRLLVADPNERCSDLSELVPIAKRLAIGSRGPQATFDEAPALCVTLLSGANGIGRFINDAVPGAELHSDEGIRKFVDDDLAGAAVHKNWRDDRAPLVVLGKQLSYTVQPLLYDNRVQPTFGWLEVAREDDKPEGPPLVQLQAGVQLHHIRTGMNLSGLQREGSSWQPLFDLAGVRMDALGVQERRFHHLLRLMTDHEESVAAESVLRVEVVLHRIPDRFGEEEEITLRLIREENVRGDLPEFLAQWFDRESHFFSLDPQREPFAEFNPNRRWMLRIAGASPAGTARNATVTAPATHTFGHADEAVLWRVHQPTNDSPPKTDAYIRPYSLQGVGALHRRHLEVLDDLRYDPFLMRAVVRPQDTASDLRRGAGRLFDEKLDDSKRTLAHAIRDRQPLFCVQGPPGTGKTTLAREVVLQTLNDNPHARILVTSQSHDPLDHLLERVEEGMDALRPRELSARSRWRRPVSVRLMSEDRLSNMESGRDATSVGARFHPSEQAKNVLESAMRWASNTNEDGWATEAPQLRVAWSRFLTEHTARGLADSIERRLVQSANIVYATANDRRLSDVRPGSFDLLIYEEASKSYPVEILGPMRLARRWLLIGDHAQLPPFDIERHERVLQREVDEAERRVAEGGLGERVWNKLGVTEPEALKSLYMKHLRMFAHLYDAGSKLASLLPAPVTPSAVHTKPALFGLSGRLTQQWRMHPAISALVRKSFYPFLEDGDEQMLAESKKHRLQAPERIVNKALVWIDVPSSADADRLPLDPMDAISPMHRGRVVAEQPGRGGGYINTFEARAVLGFLRELQKGRTARLSTVVLSPYRAQVNLLKEFLDTWDHPATGPMADRVFTVDSFQGRQADIVILSLVRNNLNSNPRLGIGFLADRSRANVMFSRAERLLVVIGCSTHFLRFQQEGNWIPNVYEFIAGHRDGVLLDGMDFLREQDWRALVEQHARRQRQGS